MANQKGLDFAFSKALSVSLVLGGKERTMRSGRRMFDGSTLQCAIGMQQGRRVQDACNGGPEARRFYPGPLQDPYYIKGPSRCIL